MNSEQILAKRRLSKQEAARDSLKSIIERCDPTKDFGVAAFYRAKLRRLEASILISKNILGTVEDDKQVDAFPNGKRKV